MSNFTAWLRWWTLLSVVAAVAATVDNKPADGYLHSGYFWPKTLYWHGIRKPPGIYWFVFFYYLAAVCCSVSGSIYARARKSLADDDSKQLFSVIAENTFTILTAAMGIGLVFISIAAVNLSDVMQAYLIGMCVIQVIIDGLRSIISFKPENVVVVYFTLAGFQLSAAFGIAALDSYRPLNQVNCAYSMIGPIICILTTAACVAEKKRFKVAGFIGASLQMVFCVLSYRIANQVADVNKTQTAAFLFTAVFNLGIVTISQMTAHANKSDTSV